MATLQNIGKLKYRGKDGLWHPLPVVVQDTGGGVSTISGKGAPTSETQGEVNQLYRDEDTQRLYICTSTDGGYTWAEVSGGGSGGGSVDVDATLTKAGQAADAKAAGDAIGKKIDKAQGAGNAGKILGIGADGNVNPQDKPVQALAGASAPTTSTAGVVGQEYYVIVNNAVTEMYVCTAVANGTYTWGLVEFGVEESDPTVPAWAKEAQKPSYTASEVGADPSGTAASQVSAHNTGTDTHSDIRLLISGLTDRLNALADSDDTTLDQLSEVVAYIKSNRTLIEAITTKKVNVTDIIDNLTTNVTNKPLSAAQGVALKALIDAITIPEALPNPNALTFTGAVTGSYDGSAPLSVAIPIGGGGSGDIIDVLMDATIEEAVAAVTVTLDTPRAYKELYIATCIYGDESNSAANAMFLRVNNTDTMNSINVIAWIPDVENATSATAKSYGVAFVKLLDDCSFYYCYGSNAANARTPHLSFGERYTGFNRESIISTLKFQSINQWTKFGVGSTIKVYGVRS